MSVIEHARFEPSHGRFDRLMAVDDRRRGAPAPEDLVLSTSRGEIVICCPLTGVALTERMAQASGLTRKALADMVEGTCPLGLDGPEQWAMVLGLLRRAVAVGGPASPALGSGPVVAAVGGSSIACFSSAQTAMEKKRFPRDARDLERQLHHSPLYRGVPVDELRPVIDRAVGVYERLELRRTPRAPWFGIMAALGIEGPADVDIQLHSAVIDGVMTERAREDPGILQRRLCDRLKRWDPVDVYRALPALADLRAALEVSGLPVELEFLGPGGDRTIARRSDWWRIDLTDRSTP